MFGDQVHRDQHFLAVINPTSRLPVEHVQRLLNTLAPPGARITSYFTRPDHPIRGLIESDLATATTAIAVGGDGTVSQVAAAILDRKIPLGIVPGGSTNMIAKTSFIPSKPQRAIELIFGPHCFDVIDVGRSDGRLLVHMGGVGLDARIFEMARSALKRRLGWLAYAPPALGALARSGTRMTVTVDNQELSFCSRLVLVANSAQLVTPDFRIIHGVERHDGVFDVIAFTADNWSAIFRSVTGLLRGRLDQAGYAVVLRGKSIRIQSDPPVSSEIDGEIVGLTPIQFDVIPSALKLIVPRNSNLLRSVVSARE
jgi:diacylglycerol kinase (ATP)